MNSTDDPASTPAKPQEAAPEAAQRSFTDTTGRRWTLAITVAQVRKVKAALGVDLLGSADGQMFKEMARNPLDFCNLLWCLLERQAAAAGISEEQFWESADDTVLGDATYAFMQAVIAFSREDKRKPLQIVLQKMYAAEEKAGAAAMEIANSPQMDQFLSRNMDKAVQAAKNALQSGGE